MNTEIQTGTIFRFNSTHDRWKGKVPINTLMVADVLEDDETEGETRHFRALAKDQPGCQGQLLNFWLDQPDDITIVGQLPPDQLNNATEWKEEFVIKQPMKFNELKPGTVFRFNTQPDWWNNPIESWKQSMVVMGNGSWRYLKHPGVYPHRHDDFEVLGQLTGDLANGREWQPKPAQLTEAEDTLPIGTKFRFRSFPSRWVYLSNTVDSSSVFEVIERRSFSGVGQCITIVGKNCDRYSDQEGVLPSDNIEIEIPDIEIDGESVYTEPAQAAQAEEKPSLQTIKIGLIFFFNKVPDRWNGRIPTNTFMVVTGRYSGNGDEAWHFRKLSKEHITDSTGTTNSAELLHCYGPDDITVIGQLPPDQLDATQFDSKFLTTAGYENAAEWRDKFKKAEKDALDAWDRVKNVEDTVKILGDSRDEWYEKAKRAHGRAEKAELLNTQLTSELDHLKRRLQLGEMGMETEPQLCTLAEVVLEPTGNECVFFDSDGEVSQKDCGCDECDGKPHVDDDQNPQPRNRLVRFLKLIW